MPNFDYDKDTGIDPHNLDEEVFSHPNRYWKYCKHATEMEKVVRKAREKVKVIRSDLIRECKRNEGKPTQMDIEAYYRSHKDHKAAKDELIDAEYDWSMAMNAVYSMSSKRHMLEFATSLYLGEYFAVPNTPHYIKQGGKRVEDLAREEKAIETRTGIRKRTRIRHDS